MIIILQKRTLRVIALSLSVCFIIIYLCACGAGVERREASSEIEIQTREPLDAEETESVLPDGYINYQGTLYAPRKNLETILLMGLDKHKMKTETIGYTNTMQSDFLLLLVLDRKNGVCEILHLDRETMTQIPKLGIGGASSGSYLAQLCLAHTYGSGGSDSAFNTMKAVSWLLGGQHIDHYMTLTMDGVARINDMVGGVTVVVPQDLTSVDPELEEGREITLKGEQALWFVRARFTLEDSSNCSRMERQEVYLKAFYEKLRSCMRKDPDFAAKLVLKTGEMFTTDYSASGLEELFEILENVEVRPFGRLEGKTIRGEEFMEFYPDQDALQETILKLFYGMEA